MKSQTRRWKPMATLSGGLRLKQSNADPGLFSVRWPRSKGTYVRRRIRAASLDEAIRLAPQVAGLVPAEKVYNDATIPGALDEALARTRRGPGSRRDWLLSVRRFLLWLNENRPGIENWVQIDRQTIRAYLEVFQGRSATTKRLALQPVRQTARFMYNEYGVRDVTAGLRIGIELATTPALVYLTDVVDFCDHLERKAPRLEVGAVLQGLAGLQLQEALRLSWDRVNLDAGLIEISGEVKNRHRNRVIPVCRRVVEALEREKGRQDRLDRSKTRIRSLKEAVILARSGCPYSGRSWRNYSREMGEAIRR